MKIAVTGPHCSGKSTLLRRIESELSHPNIKFIKFDGSTCPIKYSEKTVINNENDEMAITLWMISKMLSREIEVKYDSARKDDIIILDRCLLDQIVYPVVSSKTIDINVVEKIIYLWLNNNPYDLIFYVPKNEEFFKKVPNFNQDLEYLKNVEEMYIKVFDRLQKESQKVVILPKYQDEQKDIIISTVRGYLK